VIGIKDSITFDGETVGKLTEDFHNAIDHYLADCKSENQLPAKPYSGKLTLRVPPDIHAVYCTKDLKPNKLNIFKVFQEQLYNSIAPNNHQKQFS
jgi:predicted HicB family RNase H-like nuclease